MESATTIPRLSPTTTLLAGIQWLFFMFANTVVIPLSVAAAFHLNAAATTGSLERAFMYTGLACVLQALLGHRLPLMEGLAGLWWGTILGVAATAGEGGLPRAVVGGSIAVGIILVSGLIILIGATGLGWHLKRFTSPPVVATFYVLLAAQLSQSFLKGALGMAGGGQIVPGIAAISLVLVVLVLVLNIGGRGLVSNFALLIGIVVGWIAFTLLLPHAAPAPVPAGKQLFATFPWGAPAYDPGVILTIVIAGLISLSNSYAAIEGGNELLGQTSDSGQYRRSLMLTGLNGIVAGVFGIVPYAPYVSSLGFLRTTRILDRLSFMLGAAIFFLLGAIPLLGQLLASLPLSVGDAVLFVAYLQLIGSGLNVLRGTTFTAMTIYRLALPMLLGLAIMTIPASAFLPLPALVRILAQNGLVLGILVALIIEIAIPRSQATNSERVRNARGGETSDAE